MHTFYVFILPRILYIHTMYSYFKEYYTHILCIHNTKNIMHTYLIRKTLCVVVCVNVFILQIILCMLRERERERAREEEREYMAS